MIHHNLPLCSLQNHPIIILKGSKALLASPLTSKRYASTFDDEHFYDKNWPTKPNFTPYEVLNILPSEINRDLLKKKYYEIAKIYHPDISLNKIVKDAKGNHLTEDHKNDRFKVLTEAYTLLKDAKKRALYDQYKSGWKFDKSALLQNTFNSSHTTYTSSQQAHNWNNHAYWSASNWEDYENLKKDMNDPSLKAEKMKVLAALVFLILTSASLQGWYILDNFEQTILQKQRSHDSCEDDLSLAYTNFNLDDSRLSRIRRFLWFRTFSLYTDKAMLDRSAQENEILLKEIVPESEYDD